MKKDLSSTDTEKLLKLLKERFEKNMIRHQGLEWKKIQAKLEKNKHKIWSLNEMEDTGGEPDVVDYNKKTDEYIFFDCSPESPKGRRSLCYDGDALESRKEFKPQNSVIDMSTSMGIQLLTEEEYRKLQQLGQFDLKTSSWVQTPPEIRKLKEHFFVIDDIIMYLYITTVQNHTTPPEVFARHYLYNSNLM